MDRARDHVSAVKSGLAEQGTTMILNPRHLSPGGVDRFLWSVPPHLVGCDAERFDGNYVPAISALPAGE